MRVSFDDGNSMMKAKIREASLQKIPYTLVLGDKEAASDDVSVRTFGNQKVDVMSFQAFAEKLALESKFP
ncbi:MAG TPA: His/Gly/Thr/Pro-type tRNA ligase C-terminal domain-containing protein [Kofleriaceae bacterium]